MNNIKLYECADDVCKLLDLIEDGVDITQDTIEMVMGDFTAKAQDVIAYSLNMKSQRDALELHIKKMQDKLRTINNKIKSIDDYIFLNMRRTGIKKIESSNGSFSASIRKTAGAVDLYDISLLPEKFICTKVVTSPDKIAIKNAIKNGEEVQGARLVKSEVLSIR